MDDVFRCGLIGGEAGGVEWGRAIGSFVVSFTGLPVQAGGGSGRVRLVIRVERRTLGGCAPRLAISRQGRVGNVAG